MNINRVNQAPSFGNFFVAWEPGEKDIDNPVFLNTNIIKAVGTESGGTTLTLEGGHGKLFKINLLSSVKNVIDSLGQHKDSNKVMEMFTIQHPRSDRVSDVVDSFEKSRNWF